MSVLEFNLCSSFFVSVKMGLMNDGIVPSKKSRAHFQSQKLNNKIQFPFWYVVYLYSVWRWKICCPVKWHFWYWVSVQDQKNGRILSCLCWQQQKIPRETSSLTSIFFSMMEFPKDFVIKLITEDSTHFNCKYTLNQNQNILKILIFQF